MAKSDKQVQERTHFLEEYVPAAIRLVASGAQEGKRLEARTLLEGWLEI